jgi:hypothetical protein
MYQALSGIESRVGKTPSKGVISWLVAIASFQQRFKLLSHIAPAAFSFIPTNPFKHLFFLSKIKSSQVENIHFPFLEVIHLTQQNNFFLSSPFSKSWLVEDVVIRRARPVSVLPHGNLRAREQDCI